MLSLFLVSPSLSLSLSLSLCSSCVFYFQIKFSAWRLPAAICGPEPTARVASDHNLDTAVQRRIRIRIEIAIRGVTHILAFIQIHIVDIDVSLCVRDFESDFRQLALKFANSSRHSRVFPSKFILIYGECFSICPG